MEDGINSLINLVKSRTSSGFTLTGVKVQRHSDYVMVMIQGHGSFQHQMIPIDRFRLAIDFPRGHSSLSFRHLSVNNHLLKQIRIGQHSDKLRLVFDMVRPLRYAAKRGKNILAIQFRF